MVMNKNRFSNIVLIIVVVAVVIIGGYLAFLKKQEPTAQVTTQTLQEGNEIYIEGTYVKNTTDSELEPSIADGASYQVINTKEYGQIQIVTGGFRMNCLAKEIYQPSKGELIEIYGKVISNPSSQFFNGHSLSICLSDQYYIRKKR